MKWMGGESQDSSAFQRGAVSHAVCCRPGCAGSHAAQKSQAKRKLTNESGVREHVRKQLKTGLGRKGDRLTESEFDDLVERMVGIVKVGQEEGLLQTAVVWLRPENILFMYFLCICDGYVIVGVNFENFIKAVPFEFNLD